MGVLIALLAMSLVYVCVVKRGSHSWTGSRQVNAVTDFQLHEIEASGPAVGADSTAVPWQRSHRPTLPSHERLTDELQVLLQVPERG